MRKLTWSLLVMLFAVSLAVAQEVAQAPPAATPAAAPSTDSLFAAPAPVQDQAVLARANEIMSKSAQAYKDARTYYEQSTYTAAFDSGDTHREQSMKVTVAFDRDGTLKVDSLGQPNMTVFFKDGQTIVYNQTVNQYMKVQNQQLADVKRNLQQLATVSVALAEDPVAVLMKDVQVVDSVNETQFAGLDAYEVVYKQSRGVTSSVYFDRADYHIAGLKATIPISSPQGQGVMNFTATVEKAIFNQMPKDADGNDIDMFAFSLPETATEAQPQSPAGPPAPPAAPPAEPQPAPDPPAAN